MSKQNRYNGSLQDNYTPLSHQNRIAKPNQDLSWDMFSVFPSIIRIYAIHQHMMVSKGHPLQKDLPMSGYAEVRYDDPEKLVVSEPVEMTQEFHYFDFASPWPQGSDE